MTPDADEEAKPTAETEPPAEAEAPAPEVEVPPPAAAPEVPAEAPPEAPPEAAIATGSPRPTSARFHRWVLGEALAAVDSFAGLVRNPTRKAFYVSLRDGLAEQLGLHGGSATTSAAVPAPSAEDPQSAILAGIELTLTCLDSFTGLSPELKTWYASARESLVDHQGVMKAAIAKR